MAINDFASGGNRGRPANAELADTALEVHLLDGACLAKTALVFFKAWRLLPFSQRKERHPHNCNVTVWITQ
jgi:hypothetical protein